MKIDCKIVLKNLIGKNLKEANGDNNLTLGIALSLVLTNSEEGGKMKLYVLGKKFFDNDLVEIDSADMALVKTLLEKTRIYTPLISGQILQILEEVK